MGKAEGDSIRYAAVHGVAKSRIQLSIFTFTFHFHALEKGDCSHQITKILELQPQSFQ